MQQQQQRDLLGVEKEEARRREKEEARLLLVFDVIVKNGLLSLLECCCLKQLSRSFRKRFGDKDGYLRLIASCHCAQSQNCWRSEDWGLRFRFWKNSFITPEVVKSLLDNYGIGINPEDSESYYVSMYEKLAAMNADVTCSSPGQMGEIMRDVRRTFPSHPFFREGNRGSIALGRILKAFSIARPDIGYCQGMNFVVGVFILARLPLQVTGGCSIGTAMEANPAQDVSTQEFVTSHATADAATEEADIFMMLLALVCPQSALDMSGMWMPGVPKMKLRVYQFDRLFKGNLPRLHAHFDDLKLAPEVLVAQWIITLFSYTVPLPITMGLWDYIMVGGWAAVYRIALTILRYKEDELLIMDLDEVGKTMREWKGTQSVGSSSKEVTSLISLDEWDTFLGDSDRLTVTSEVLMQLHEHYGLELIFSAEHQDQITVGGKDGNKFYSTDSSEGMQESPPTIKRENSNSSVGSNTSKTRDLEPAQVGWFERYGENLSPVAQNDMTFLAEELRSLDIQVEKDKICLQKKILETCDMIKVADERARKAIRKQGILKLQVGELERSLEETVFRAEKIGYYVGVLMNTSNNIAPNAPPNEVMSETSELGASRESSMGSDVSDIVAVSELDPEKCQLYVEDLEAEYLSKDAKSSKSTKSRSTSTGTFTGLMTKSRGFGGAVVDNESSKASNISGQSEKKAGGTGIGSFMRGIANHFGKGGGTSSTSSSGTNVDADSIKKDFWVESQGQAQCGRVLVNVGDEKEKQNALLSRIQFFSQESSRCQNDIIEITRRLTELKTALARVEKFMQSAVIAAEDALTRKKSLCEQLQLLSQTANGERSRKLQIAADVYGT